MTFTRREKQVLTILVALMFGVAVFTTISNTNILTLNAFFRSYEPHIILLVGFPLGLYLAFDKERNSKK